MVELQPSKLATGVRFPSPAPFFLKSINKNRGKDGWHWTVFLDGQVLGSVANEHLRFSSFQVSKEKRDKHTQVIIDEADRLTLLVNDILNLSKLQSQSEIIEKKCD